MASRLIRSSSTTAKGDRSSNRGQIIPGAARRFRLSFEMWRHLIFIALPLITAGMSIKESFKQPTVKWPNTTLRWCGTT